MFYSYVPNAVKTRKRTSAHQLSILEEVFVTDKKPNSVRRKELSGRLNMTPREVQVWFQNRRAKEKKLATQRSGQPGSSPHSNSTSPASASAAPSSIHHDSGSEHGSPVADDASSSTALELSMSPVADVGPKDPSPRLRSRPTPHLQANAPSSWHGAPPSSFPTHRLSPGMYEQRRSSLPSPSLATFSRNQPSHFPLHMSISSSSGEYARHSIHTLDQHPVASLARRASLVDPRGTYRYHPWANAQAQQRTSAPDIFDAPQPRPAFQHASPVAQDFHHQGSPATPFDGWNNVDPFGTGTAAAPGGDGQQQQMGLLGDHGHHTMVEGIVAGGPLSAYEFPPKDPQRQSVGSVNSLPYSEGSTSTGTGGPYYSDIPSSEEEDGRRGSCVSASDMLNTLSVGDEYHAAVAARNGGEYSGSDSNTVSYPSPPSDRGRSVSVPTLPHAAPIAAPMERSMSYSVGHDDYAAPVPVALPPAHPAIYQHQHQHQHQHPQHDQQHSPHDVEGMQQPYKYGDGGGDPSHYATEYVSPTSSYGYGRTTYAAPQPSVPAFVEPVYGDRQEYDAGGVQRY